MDEVISFLNSNFKWLSWVVGLAFVGAFAWQKNKFPTRKEHNALSDSVSQLTQEVHQIKGELEHIPSKDEVHRLDKAITGLTESNRGVRASLQKLDKKTDLLLENELKGS